MDYQSVVTYKLVAENKIYVWLEWKKTEVKHMESSSKNQRMSLKLIQWYFFWKSALKDNSEK